MVDDFIDLRGYPYPSAYGCLCLMPCT